MVVEILERIKIYLEVYGGLITHAIAFGVGAYIGYRIGTAIAKIPFMPMPMGSGSSSSSHQNKFQIELTV